MKRWIRNTVITGATLAGIGAFLHRDVIPDKFFHKPSSQEKLLQDVYFLALGEMVTVRCLPQSDINRRVWPFTSTVPGKVKKAATAPLWDVVWLKQDICTTLDTFSQKPDKTIISDEEAAALHAVSHEGSHITGNLFNEGEAECEAVQYTELLARALGASAAAAQDARRQVARLVGDPAATSESYVIPEGCYDGGPLDRDPNKPGIFPQFAPQINPDAVWGW